MTSVADVRKIHQGLERVLRVLKPLPAGFYGLHHMVLLRCFMALCRIGNAEQLKNHSPGELGKLLELSGCWFREIRKLSDNGHQTAIITTHPSLPVELIASRMFSRWAQENYFKYMGENFEFDRMMEYGTQAVDPKRTIPNPEYRKLSYRIKKNREKKARLEAKIFKKMGDVRQTTIEQAMENIAISSDLIEQVNGYEEAIGDLLRQRKGKPSRISIAEKPAEKRFDKLLIEGKKFKNAMLMIAYRAESALYNIMGEFYKNREKDGRMLLKEIFSTHADLYPDYANKTLTVTLHTLSSPRANQAAAKLCEFLNQTETEYPYTDLKLIY